MLKGEENLKYGFMDTRNNASALLRQKKLISETYAENLL
jgi:hypothetical protein